MRSVAVTDWVAHGVRLNCQEFAPQTFTIKPLETCGDQFSNSALTKQLFVQNRLFFLELIDFVQKKVERKVNTDRTDRM